MKFFSSPNSNAISHLTRHEAKIIADYYNFISDFNLEVVKIFLTNIMSCSHSTLQHQIKALQTWPKNVSPFQTSLQKLRKIIGTKTIYNSETSETSNNLRTYNCQGMHVQIAHPSL